MSLLRNGNVIGGISKALLSKIGFSDLTTGAQNLCDGVNELDDKKVDKAGDTMTGNLNLKDTSVDASQTNNGVSSIQYPTSFHILDNETRILARVEAVINPNGNIGSYWYVRNYDTSGGQVAQKGIAMHMNKSGALSYSVSDGEAFATAIGKYTRSSVGTLDWNSTNQQLLMTKSSMAFWNGAYSGTSSNLQYCDRGRFGTIVTKGSGDYLPIGGGTMTGAIGFNNATTRRKTAQNLTSENVSSPGYVVSLTDNWGTFGYSSIAQLKAKFGYGTIVTKNAGDYIATTGGNITGTNRFKLNNNQEIYQNETYLILGTSNMVCVRTYNNINAAKPIQAASFQTWSSRLIKKNITDITQDEAKSLLNLRVVDFDYIEQVGGQTNQTGIIAEEALTVYPKCVDIPENYNEDEVKKAIETGDAINAMNVDYTKLIAPLIKLVQMQQKEIDDLKAAIKTS